MTIQLQLVASSKIIMEKTSECVSRQENNNYKINSKRSNGKETKWRRRDHPSWTIQKKKKRTTKECDVITPTSMKCNHDENMNKDNNNSVSEKCMYKTEASQLFHTEESTKEKVRKEIASTNSEVLVYDSENEKNDQNLHSPFNTHVMIEKGNNDDDKKEVNLVCLQQNKTVECSARVLLHQVAKEILEHEEWNQLKCGKESPESKHNAVVDNKDENCKSMKCTKKWLSQLGGIYHNLAAGKEFCVWLKPPEYNFSAAHELHNRLCCCKNSIDNSTLCATLEDKKEINDNDKSVDNYNTDVDDHISVRRSQETKLQEFIVNHHDELTLAQRKMITELKMYAQLNKEYKQIESKEEVEDDSQISAAHAWPAPTEQPKKDMELENSTLNNVSTKSITPRKDKLCDHDDLSPGERAVLSLLSIDNLIADSDDDSDEEEMQEHSNEDMAESHDRYSNSNALSSEFSAAAIYDCNESQIQVTMPKARDSQYVKARVNNKMNMSVNQSNDVINNWHTPRRTQHSASLSGNLIALQLRQYHKKAMQLEKQLFTAD